MSVNTMSVTEFAVEPVYDEETAPVAETVSSSKYLIFLIDDLKLGVKADNVTEILTNQLITYLPMVPGYVHGIFNMRGQIVPVVDVRTRMGKPSLEDNRLLVVLSYENSQVGIFVDAVDQMIEIPDSAITPMPAQSTQVLVSDMCTIPDGSGTMLVLDCAQLFGHE